MTMAVIVTPRTSNMQAIVTRALRGSNGVAAGSAVRAASKRISDAARGRAKRGVHAEAFLGNAEEGLGEGCWQDGFSVFGTVAKRRTPGKSFDQNDAEGPDIRSRGYLPVCDFGRSVIARRRGLAGIGKSIEAVGRKLQPVTGNHDVGGLEMAVHEIVGVQPGKRLQNRVEHRAGLGRGKRTLAKNLREDLVGIFSDDIEEVCAVELAVSGVQNTHQVRMRQGLGRRPFGEAGIGIEFVGGNELDGGFLCRFVFEFCQVDTGVRRSAEPAEKRESAGDGASDTIGADK